MSNVSYNNGMTVSQYITDFLEYMEIEKNRSQATIKNYDFYLRRFVAMTKISNPKQISNDLIRSYRLQLNRLPSKQPDVQLKKRRKTTISLLFALFSNT